MPSEKIKSTSVTPISNPHPDLHEEIRRRAYELYESRGREDGHDVDDWRSALIPLQHLRSANSRPCTEQAFKCASFLTASCGL